MLNCQTLINKGDIVWATELGQKSLQGEDDDPRTQKCGGEVDERRGWQTEECVSYMGARQRKKQE